MIVIDVADEGDLPLILEIEHEAISPPWTHGALLSEIYRGDSFFAVARNIAGDPMPGANSGQPAYRESAADDERPPINGFVILRRTSEDEGELLQIAVGKAALRRGVADLLMNAALDHAAANSILSVFLEVRKSNEAAISLYKKHGFGAVRTRRDYYNDPVEDALVMSRHTKSKWHGHF